MKVFGLYRCFKEYDFKVDTMKGAIEADFEGATVVTKLRDIIFTFLGTEVKDLEKEKDRVASLYSHIHSQELHYAVD